MAAPDLRKTYKPTERDFPTDLAGRQSLRVGGVLIEESQYANGGMQAHFWLYPSLPASRLNQALREYKRHKELLNWTWSYIPNEHVPRCLHSHLRDLLLLGSKQLGNEYAFGPDVTLQICEIYDIYREKWPSHLLNPRRHKRDMLAYARSRALDFRESLNRVLDDVRCDSKLRGILEADEDVIVEISIFDLTELLRLSGDILYAETGEQSCTAPKGYPVFG